MAPNYFMASDTTPVSKPKPEPKPEPKPALNDVKSVSPPSRMLRSVRAKSVPRKGFGEGFPGSKSGPQEADQEAQDARRSPGNLLQNPSPNPN